MVFSIRQESTLPILSMKIVMDDYTYYDDLMKRLETAKCVFSLFDTTGTPILLNKKGSIKLVERLHDSNYKYDIYIQYQFSKIDTKKAGHYLGEFSIRFFDGVVTEECSDELKLPIVNELYINIKPSLTKTTIIDTTC